MIPTFLSDYQKISDKFEKSIKFREKVFIYTLCDSPSIYEGVEENKEGEFFQDFMRDPVQRKFILIDYSNSLLKKEQSNDYIGIEQMLNSDLFEIRANYATETKYF